MRLVPALVKLFGCSASRTYCSTLIMQLLGNAHAVDHYPQGASICVRSPRKPGLTLLSAWVKLKSSDDSNNPLPTVAGEVGAGRRTGRAPSTLPWSAFCYWGLLAGKSCEVTGTTWVDSLLRMTGTGIVLITMKNAFPGCRQHERGTRAHGRRSHMPKSILQLAPISKGAYLCFSLKITES